MATHPALLTVTALRAGTAFDVQLQDRNDESMTKCDGERKFAVGVNTKGVMQEAKRKRQAAVGSLSLARNSTAASCNRKCRQDLVYQASKDIDI